MQFKETAYKRNLSISPLPLETYYYRGNLDKKRKFL